MAALALVGLCAVGFAGWWLSSEPPAPHVTGTSDDDLELLARGLDAGPPPAPEHLAVDADGLYVARGNEGLVEARPRSGGAARTLAKVGAPVGGLAAASGAVWIAAGRAVHRVPVASGPDVHVTDGLSRAGALAVDATSVFVVDVDPGGGGLVPRSSLVRVPASGGTPVVLARAQGEIPGVVLDESSAYFCDPLEGSVVAVPKAGGAPRVLATDRGLPGELVMVGDALVWVERRSESLFAVPKAGGTPRAITQDFAGFAHLVARGRAVAWVDEAAVDGAFRVLSVGLDGGEVAAQSPAVDGVDALASDGARLFWLRGDEASEVPAAD